MSRFLTQRGLFAGAVLLGALLIFLASDASFAQRAKAATGDSSVLLGDQSVEPHQDRLRSGRIEVFRFRARTSGVASVMGVYVDADSRARALAVGIYGDADGSPSSLLSWGSTASLTEGAWSLVPLTPTRLVRGRVYWLAVLGEGGTLRYRGGESGPCTSDRSRQTHLRHLPARWTSGGRAERAGCSISGYVAAAGSVPAAGPSASGSPPSSPSVLVALPAAVEEAPARPSSPPTEPAPGEPNTKPHEEPDPPSPPVDVEPPAISGSSVVGAKLSATSGAWQGNPTSYEYQWQDCNAFGEGCLSISRAEMSSYTLTPSDLDSTVRVVVTATNAGGSTPSPSRVTAIIEKGKKEEKREEKKENREEKHENCFENPETEGTSRIEACGYPGQKNVGVEDCEALAKSGSKTITKAETIEDTDIVGDVAVDASGVTLNHDCVIDAGESAVKLEGTAASVTISNSTVRGENATTGRVEAALASEYSDTGVATKDRLEDCEECVNGWKWTVKESFVIANGELKNPAIHREDWFDNRGWVIADDDTMLNPETQTAIVFSEDSGVPCENETMIEGSLVAGSGYMFQNCAHASGSGTGKFVFRDNRLARCTGKVVHGEGNYCEGPNREIPESGFDADGYFPDGGYFGIFGTCETCTYAGVVWEGNYWNNNLEAVAAP